MDELKGRLFIIWTRMIPPFDDAGRLGIEARSWSAVILKLFFVTVYVQNFKKFGDTLTFSDTQ